MTAPVDAPKHDELEAKARSGDVETVDVTSCQLCGSEERAVYFEDDPYKVLRCANCGFVYVTPRLGDEPLKDVYDHEYWNSDSPKEKGYADYASEAPLYLKTFRRRSKLLRRFLKKQSARVLDVGCAAGFFLRVMKEQGHTVKGCELSESIGKVAEESLGSDNVYIGHLIDTPVEKGFEKHSFDLVTMWDVIEHVPHPQRLLDECKDMLAPGGHLLLETQNVQSRFAKLLGKKWHHFKHQEHIFHFDPKTIRDILEDRGFEVVHQGAAFGGKFVSLGFIAERAGRLHPVLSVLLKPLALLKSVNVYLNFRDEMIVVARVKEQN